MILFPVTIHGLTFYHVLFCIVPSKLTCFLLFIVVVLMQGADLMDILLFPIHPTSDIQCITFGHGSVEVDKYVKTTAATHAASESLEIYFTLKHQSALPLLG